MLTQSQAKIVSWSAAGEEVCASAARISTTQGDALALFEKAQGNPRNQDLIGKVLRSGHRSVIEHAVFSIALQNVSVYVEQYFIERRLASFTVKSRRYVDFSGLGYYIPPELEGEALAGYKSYMDGLFAAYQRLLDADVPKEDARFLLPYAFCSNFYCTLNARELVSLIQSIRAGQGGAAPELQAIAEQLAEQLNERFPALGAELEAALPAEETSRLLHILLAFPQGVQAMSVDFPVVQTSLNLGTMAMEEDGLHFSFSVRSSVASQKEMVIQRIRGILELGGGTLAVRGSYPGWQYAKESVLREDILAAYKEVSGKDGVIEAIHAGLECGLFIEKMPGLDAVSVGPEMHDVHSVQEKLSVPSTAMVYRMMRELLKRSR